jgi:hypothetical protein
MNERRGIDERFTLQNISEHLGYSNWRELEDITEGRANISSADIVRIAHGLGLSERWLLEGKETPFQTDLRDYHGADEQFEAILRINPRRLIFVRMEDEDFESIIVAETDDFRWRTFIWDHPTGSHVGGTGRVQLFEYCCLMRRLYRTLDHVHRCPLYGKHLSKTDFMRLWEGEVYPGTFLSYQRNDQWWIYFAELSDDGVEGESAQAEELRNAIFIAKTVLVEYQSRSGRSIEWQKLLAEVGFPLQEQKSLERYPLDAGLSRD